MECKYICNFLCAYLDGELPPQKMEIIEEHLNSCDFCREELDSQKAIKYLIQSRFCDIIAPASLKRRIMFELDHAEEYRESGIQVLDLVRWGTHIAQFYKTKDDLIEVLVPYIGTGLEQNEMCLWVTACVSKDEAIASLNSKIPGIQGYINKGQLQILSYKDWYLKNGCFDCNYTLKSGLEKSNEAVSCGYSGLRVTGDVFWLDDTNWSSFMEYEKNINHITVKNKVLILCSYKENEFSQNNMADVENSHKYIISKNSDDWMLKKNNNIG